MFARRKTPLMEREPRFEDIACSLMSVPRMPRAVVKECREAMKMGREFNEQVVRPNALELDRMMQEDPTYLPWDFIKEANKWGFFTMWVPKLFGGHGWNLGSLYYLIEEVSSGCVGMANLIGVHYFGTVILISSWNIRLIDMILRETAEGERTGKPCIISGVVTEPEAGTDAEEVELLSKARVSCRAQKVDGGYVVNGRKVFISNGHLSTWHMLMAYEDLERPAETTVMLAVKNGMDGFSFGRMEQKMGQKGCPASELIFEDCFIPDENVCFSEEQGKDLRRNARETTMQVIDLVVASSRPGVGAFATGVARGAYEEALKFARQTEVDGKLLINHEWAQCLLAEMYKNVAVGRLTYEECMYANGLYGLAKLLQLKPIYYYSKIMPNSVFDKFVAPYNKRASTTKLFRKLCLDMQKEEEAWRTSGWASLSKFVASDIGVKNCQLAIELMGQAGLRQDRRVEKHLRDARLLQIYEGTNQLNRLNLFKCLIGRSIPEARVFEE